MLECVIDGEASGRLEPLEHTQWDYEVRLVQQARYDLEPFISEQSLLLREVAKEVVSKKMGCAIINGSVAWGYARKGSDIDIDYYPIMYCTLGISGGITAINVRDRFHHKFKSKGYESEGVGFDYSMAELKRHLMFARITGKVSDDLVEVFKLGKCGIVIGKTLEKLISRIDKLKRSLSYKQQKEAKLDRFFEIFTPIKSAVRKSINALQDRGETVPESVITLRDYLKRY